MICKRIAALLAVAATAAFLSGCTSASSDGHDDHVHTSGEETTVIVGEPAAFNAADTAFATDMIPHHQQAVDMSALVPERSTNPEVIALAQQISAAQEPEINTLKVFLVQWKGGSDDENGNPTSTMPGMDHSGHGGGMSGMVDEATMTQLKALKGAEFDKLWLQSMISHHEGAIEMSETELSSGTNADAKQLAQNIIDGQQAELTQMHKMLGDNT